MNVVLLSVDLFTTIWRQRQISYCEILKMTVYCVRQICLVVGLYVVYKNKAVNYSNFLRLYFDDIMLKILFPSHT